MSTWARLTALGQRVIPRARDIVFIVVAFGSGTAEALARRDQGAAVWVPVFLVGVAGSACLWWRRPYPVIVTVVGIAVELATQIPVVMAVGLFSLAIRRRDRVLAVMTLAVGVAFAVKWSDDGSESMLELGVLGALQAGFFAAAGAYIGARRDLVVSLRDRATRAEHERELKAEQAKLAERARIAREMHDVLAHKVSLIALHAGGLQMNPNAEPAAVERTAGLIRATAREAMEDLREVLGVLRADAGDADVGLTPQPRSGDIERVVAASRAAGMRVDLVMEVADLPDALARTINRVVQEALTNVHKHARGAESAVSVSGNERAGVTVAVVNHRPVAKASLLPGSGAGLLGLRERIALSGGTFESGPAPDGGWRVAAWLPWSADHRRADGAIAVTGGAA